MKLTEIVKSLEAADVDINKIEYDEEGELCIDAEPMDIMERVLKEMGWME